MANGTFHDDEIKAETAKSDANEPDDCRVVSLCRGRRQFSFSSPPKKLFRFCWQLSRSLPSDHKVERETNGSGPRSRQE